LEKEKKHKKVAAPNPPPEPAVETLTEDPMDVAAPDMAGSGKED